MRPGAIVCASEGCSHEATHFPKINVPATGFPAIEARSVGVVLALKLCRDCAATFPSLAQFEPGAPGAIREVIEVMCRGKVPPDFARAFTTAVPLAEGEGLAMDRATSTTH